MQRESNSTFSGPTYLGQDIEDGVDYREANVTDSIHEVDVQEENDLSRAILSYMDRFLREENVEDIGCTLQDSLKLIQVGHTSGEPNPTGFDELATIDAQAISSFAHEDSQQGDDDDDPNAILRYMDKILMEDDADNMGYMLQDSLKLQLQAKEKSFYEIIGKKYPPSPDCSSQNPTCEVGETAPVFQTSESTLSSTNSTSKGEDGHKNMIQLPEIDNGNESVSLFIKGAEEASKLIPNLDEFIATSKRSGEQQAVLDEELPSKQANTHDDVYHSNIFDEILLDHAGDQNKAVTTLRETLKNEAMKKACQNGQGYRRKTNRRKVTDLRSLLMSCARAVAADDITTAHVILKQIRLHSSPFGDGKARLAYSLANGLEARLAGTGSQIYRSLISKRPSTISMLKTYHLYVSACPFTRVSNSFVGITIRKQTLGAARIHIIDFGILYGFQWPTFIQRFSTVTDSPPKIRITGIEFPQPGFRPAERVEETGRRLAHYAKMFNISFEFTPIAKRWESIEIEDLKLDKDEVVIVNCIYRMKHLPDETMVVDSSRNAVLRMIRRINPAVFIQGVVNGAYNAPYFLTRFRDAFFHFSSLFDMLDTIVPRDCDDRILLERDLLGREVFNVVACEGWDRVDRPETYRQWHNRTSRVGFVQCPLDPQIKDRAKLRVNPYCKEFVVDQDGQWLLLRWKGKILYALSTWKPDSN